MENQLTRVPFYGDDLEAVTSDGECWVPLATLCLPLDLDPQAQRQRLGDIDRSPWARTRLLAVSTPAGPREVFCVDLDTMAMWLVTIVASRLKDPGAKAKVILYQREAARALRDYFTTGVAVNPRRDEAALRRGFERQVAGLEERLATVTKQLAFTKLDDAARKIELERQKAEQKVEREAERAWVKRRLAKDIRDLFVTCACGVVFPLSREQWAAGEKPEQCSGCAPPKVAGDMVLR